MNLKLRNIPISPPDLTETESRRMKKHMNDNQIRDYDKVLDAEFGAPGTPERIAAEAQARAFYSEHLSGKVAGMGG